MEMETEMGWLHWAVGVALWGSGDGIDTRPSQTSTRVRSHTNTFSPNHWKKYFEDHKNLFENTPFLTLEKNNLKTVLQINRSHIKFYNLTKIIYIFAWYSIIIFCS